MARCSSTVIHRRLIPRYELYVVLLIVFYERSSFPSEALQARVIRVRLFIFFQNYRIETLVAFGKKNCSEPSLE